MYARPGGIRTLDLQPTPTKLHNSFLLARRGGGNTAYLTSPWFCGAAAPHLDAHPKNPAMSLCAPRHVAPRFLSARALRRPQVRDRASEIGWRWWLSLLACQIFRIRNYNMALRSLKPPNKMGLPAPKTDEPPIFRPLKQTKKKAFCLRRHRPPEILPWGAGQMKCVPPLLPAKDSPKPPGLGRTKDLGRA